MRPLSGLWSPVTVILFTQILEGLEVCLVNRWNCWVLTFHADHHINQINCTEALTCAWILFFLSVLAFKVNELMSFLNRLFVAAGLRFARSMCRQQVCHSSEIQMCSFAGESSLSLPHVWWIKQRCFREAVMGCDLNRCSKDIKIKCSKTEAQECLQRDSADTRWKYNENRKNKPGCQA